MSWDAYLHDDRGHLEGDWNYTHNCNGMANLALNANYEQQPVFTEVFQSSGESWWRMLDGMTGAEGGEFLSFIICQMEAEPEKYRAINPDNGWGSYDTFLGVLREMHKASLVEWPTVWSVNG